MNPRTFYVGVKAAVCVGDKCVVLLKKRPERTYWDIPGGRVGNETLLEALEREVREELPGIGNYSVEGLIDAYALERDVPDGNRLAFVVYKVVAEPFELLHSDEHVEARLLTQDEVRTLEEETGIELAPHTKAVLAALA